MAHIQFLLTIVGVLCVSHVFGDSDEDHEHPPIPGPLGLILSNSDQELYKSCLTENGLTKEDLEKGSPEKELSQKELCYIKCMTVKSGGLSKDGDIMINSVKESLSQVKPLSSTDVTDIVKCLSGITGKITTCSDMKKMIDCLPKPPKRPQ